MALVTEVHRQALRSVLIGFQRLDAGPHRRRVGLELVREPVVHLELQPGSGEHVQARGRRELPAPASEQLLADQRRVRPLALRRHRGVAAEARADRAHRDVTRVRPAAVDRSRQPGGRSVTLRAVRVIALTGGGVPRKAGVVEVVLTQAVAQAEQGQVSERAPEPIPVKHPVKQLRNVGHRRADGIPDHRTPPGICTGATVICHRVTSVRSVELYTELNDHRAAPFVFTDDGLIIPHALAGRRANS
jgi:hypothetical protein